MKTGKMRVGIVGFGEMGKRLGRDLLDATSNMVEISGAVDPSDTMYEKGCEWIQSKPKRYATVKDMVRDANLDGIIIASPNSTHFDNLKALEGLALPVLIEKPLDAGFDRICDVVRFSKRYAGAMMVDHVMRHAPILLKAKEILDGGGIGNICSFTFIQNCHYGNMQLFRGFRKTMAGGGGHFIEKATHDFDILLSFLAGRPERVMAVARRQTFGGDKPNDLRCRNCDEQFTCEESVGNMKSRMGSENVFDALALDDGCVYTKEIDVPDNEVCLIEFDNGVFGTYAQCFFSPTSYSGREYEIMGDRGVMRISLSCRGKENEGRILICPRYGTPGDSQEYLFDYRNRIHYNGGHGVARCFYRMMTSGAAPLTTVEQAFAAEVVGYAAILASQENRSVVIADLLSDDIKNVWETDE